MDNIKICVIGLGYVGLPLARLFSTKFPTVGFDLNQERVDALMQGHDATLEVSDDLLQDAISNHGFTCTTDLEKIRHCNFYVVAVPTPVNDDHTPDLTPVEGASRFVGQNLKKGNKALLSSLQEEAAAAAQDRRTTAKKLGEEAGTKLLLPMAMMLAVTMLIIIVPACFGFM